MNEMDNQNGCIVKPTNDSIWTDGLQWDSDELVVLHNQHLPDSLCGEYSWPLSGCMKTSQLKSKAEDADTPKNHRNKRFQEYIRNYFPVNVHRNSIDYGVQNHRVSSGNKRKVIFVKVPERVRHKCSKMRTTSRSTQRKASTSDSHTISVTSTQSDHKSTTNSRYCNKLKCNSNPATVEEKYSKKEANSHLGHTDKVFKDSVAQTVVSIGTDTGLCRSVSVQTLPAFSEDNILHDVGNRPIKCMQPKRISSTDKTLVKNRKIRLVRNLTKLLEFVERKREISRQDLVFNLSSEKTAMMLASLMEILLKILVEVISILFPNKKFAKAICAACEQLYVSHADVELCAPNIRYSFTGLEFCQLNNSDLWEESPIMLFEQDTEMHHIQYNLHANKLVETSFGSACEIYFPLGYFNKRRHRLFYVPLNNG